MSTIITRAGKGSPLTHNEVDANFNNLNTDKAEVGSANTFTAAQTISNQLNLTKATDYNLYASGAGSNYMEGKLGIGALPASNLNVVASKDRTGSTTYYNIYSGGQIKSDVTTLSSNYFSIATTEATAFTLTTFRHYDCNTPTIGAGSAITTQVGYGSRALSGATNNYSFQGATAAATGAFNLYMSGTANNYLAGSLGIGAVGLTQYGIRLSKNITGNAVSYGMRADSTVQSDVTNTAYFGTAISTQATAFTLSALYHYFASQSTVGAGSAITAQSGFHVDTTLIGATNNYGFYGNIAAGTGRYNLYMAGTADNYLAGSLGIGAVPVAGTNLNISKNLTGSTGVTGVWVSATVQSDATVNAFAFRTNISTAAAAFTLPDLVHYYAVQGTIGATSAVTRQYGFLAESSLIGAVNNYGFRGNIAAGTNRYNLYMNGTADNYLAGGLGIGGLPTTGINLRIGGNSTGITTIYGIQQSQAIQSDVTVAAYLNHTAVTTQAASFTLSSLYHYSAAQGTIGATSAVTSQYGYIANSSLTGATNNYGFFGNIAAATGRYNLYMNGTADNYIAGSLGIGTTSLTGINLFVAKNITGATSSFGIAHSASVQSDVTTNAYGMNVSVSTAAAAFTLTNLYLHRVTFGGLGASSAVTNMFGYFAESTITSATNNYGFYGNIAAGTGRYNLYMAGTAQNLFSGDVLVFGAGGLGYTTGSGGAVTQATSRTTGVTLNKTNGAITLVSAAGSVTYSSFTVTNSTVAATDVIHVCQKSGTDKYIVLVTAVAAGSFQITFATTSGVTTEQPVFNFAVMKAVAA